MFPSRRAEQGDSDHRNNQAGFSLVRVRVTFHLVTGAEAEGDEEEEDEDEDAAGGEGEEEDDDEVEDRPGGGSTTSIGMPSRASLGSLFAELAPGGQSYRSGPICGGGLLFMYFPTDSSTCETPPDILNPHRR